MRSLIMISIKRTEKVKHILIGNLYSDIICRLGEIDNEILQKYINFFRAVIYFNTRFMDRANLTQLKFDHLIHMLLLYYNLFIH